MTDLERQYKIAAKIVEKHGDTYLPIFELFHAEIQKKQAKQGIRDIALAIASKESEFLD